MLEAKPYLLKNQIMNYAWGTKNKAAFIPHLLGLPVEPDTPYAELWMGAHPRAPSVLETLSADLFQLIQKVPELVLGSDCLKRFGSRFPYLFKVLSAGEALSIQAHPDKKQAEQLHAKDPDHYPDDNHKPEIAIALSSLTALVGFRSFTDLIQMLEDYHEISGFIGDEYIQAFKACKTEAEQRQHLKSVYSMFMTKALKDPLEYQKAVLALSERLDSRTRSSETDILFRELMQKYGPEDVGLFALYFLNFVHLQSGEAVFLKAGIPHAYVKGNILECMANSDNVVRAGLTPKFKDVETLTDILTYEMSGISLYKTYGSEKEILYNPPVDDFAVKQIYREPDEDYTVENNSSPNILLVTQGQIEIMWGSDSALKMKQGNAVFIPPQLKKYRIQSDNSSAQCFIACVIRN